MFSHTNNQPLPLVVVDEQGKRKKAKRVKLVVSDTESTERVITRAIIVLHKK